MRYFLNSVGCFVLFLGSWGESPSQTKIPFDALSHTSGGSSGGSYADSPQNSTDWTVAVSQPAFPTESQVPPGSCYTNSFGQRVCRMSTLAENCVHEYVDRSAHNADDTVLWINCGSGGRSPVFVNLSGADKSRIGSLLPIPAPPSGGGLQSYGMMWDPEIPTRMWWVSGTYLGRFDFSIPYSGTGTHTVVRNIVDSFNLTAWPFTMLGPTQITPYDDITGTDLYAQIMGMSPTSGTCRMLVQIQHKSKRSLGIVQMNYCTNTVQRADQDVLMANPSPSLGAGHLLKFRGINQGQGTSLNYITPLFGCWDPDGGTDSTCTASENRNYVVAWGQNPFGTSNAVGGNTQQVHSAILGNTQLWAHTAHEMYVQPGAAYDSLIKPPDWPVSGYNRAYQILYSDLTSTTPLGADELFRLPYVSRFYWASQSAMEGVHMSCNAVSSTTCVVSLYHENSSFPIHTTHEFAHLILSIQPTATFSYNSGTKVGSNSAATTRRLAWAGTLDAQLGANYWGTTRASQSLVGTRATYTSLECRARAECDVRNPVVSVSRSTSVWTTTVN